MQYTIMKQKSMLKRITAIIFGGLGVGGGERVEQELTGVVPGIV